MNKEPQIERDKSLATDLIITLLGAGALIATVSVAEHYGLLSGLPEIAEL